MTEYEKHIIRKNAMNKYKYCITGNFSNIGGGQTLYKFGKYKTIEAANDALYQLKKNGYFNLSIVNYFYGEDDGFEKRYYFEITDMFKYYKYFDNRNNYYGYYYGFNINEKHRFYIEFYDDSFQLRQDISKPGYVSSNLIYKSSRTYNYEQVYDELIIFKEIIMPKYLSY